MLDNELLKKDPDEAPVQVHLNILDCKSSVCMANTGKDTKQTIYVAIIIDLVRNGEEFNLHKTVWCEGVLQLSYIGTKNFRED